MAGGREEGAGGGVVEGMAAEPIKRVAVQFLKNFGLRSAGPQMLLLADAERRVGNATSNPRLIAANIW